MFYYTLAILACLKTLIYLKNEKDLGLGYKLAASLTVSV